MGNGHASLSTPSWVEGGIRGVPGGMPRTPPPIVLYLSRKVMVRTSCHSLLVSRFGRRCPSVASISGSKSSPWSTGCVSSSPAPNVATLGIAGAWCCSASAVACDSARHYRMLTGRYSHQAGAPRGPVALLRASGRGGYSATDVLASDCGRCRRHPGHWQRRWGDGLPPCHSGADPWLGREHSTGRSCRAAAG